VSKAGYANFYNKIQNRIILALNRTIEAYLINGDIRTDVTPVAGANVNYFDIPGTGVIPTDAYYLSGNGLIRYMGID
jgi:hypothetical protein